MSPKIRRIARDLLLLCRKAVGVESRTSVSPLLDRELLNVAKMHRLGAMIECGRHPEDQIAPPLAANLGLMKASAIGFELEMEPHWNRVLSRFEAESLGGRFRSPLVVLKGAHLRRAVYRERSYIREMSDLDLLVGDGDRDAVNSVLRSLGLSKGESRQPAFHRALQHDEPWFQRLPSGRYLKVDVHRGLMDTLRGTPPIDTLMRDTEVFDGYEALRTLSSIHCAVHCALHLATDDFSGTLRSLVDLDLLIQLQGLKVEDFAREDEAVVRSSGPLFMAFTILHSFLKGVDESYDEYQRAIRLNGFRRRVLRGLIDYEKLVLGRDSSLEGMRKFMVQTVTIEPVALRVIYPCYQSVVLGYKAARGVYSKIASA